MLLIATGLHAANYKFYHLDSKRGLPHQQVEALEFDADGTLWIGTRNGLSRYDGYDIRTYFHTDDARSLRHNLVHALHVDRRQRLWVCTETGICRYCPETDDFRCYSEPEGLFWSMAEDADGRIFFGGNILCRYDEDTDSLLPLPLLTDAFVNSLAVAPSGQLYVATNSEILCYDRTLTRITRLPESYYADFMTSRNVIVPLFFDSKGRLWVGRNGKGVMNIDLKSGRQQVIPSHDISSGFVRCITEDARHRIWLGTEKGITVLHPDGRTEVLRHRFQDVNSLSDDAIYTIRFDKAQNMWVGSYFGGVDYLLSANEQFVLYEPGEGEGHMPARVPRMMAEDGEGTLWIATEDGGVLTLDTESGRCRPFNGIPGLGTNIHALMFDSAHQEMWIGTRFEGIYRYDLRTRRSQHYLYDHGLTSEGCFDITLQRNGQLWVATMQGLKRYDRRTDTFSPVGHDVLDSVFIYTLHTDRHDNLWVGTNNHGFYRIDVRTRRVTGYSLGDGTGLRDNYIICLHEDAYGRIWIGTNNNGLQFLDPKTGTITGINEEMLAHCTVCSFEEDDKGNLWVSTSQGLFSYNLRTRVITRFSSETNGLPSNQFNYESALRSSDGRLYFGTINGLIAFNPDAVGQNKGPFQVHFKNINGATERLTLSHEQASQFTIEYGVIRPEGTANIRYQVRLEGVDREWRDVGSERRISGYKLPSGKYRFYVRANNNNEGWEACPVRALEIVVHPPLWRTWWAYLLYGLIIGGITYAIWRFFQLRMHEKNEMRLAHIEHEHLRQLDKVKSDFFTTAAHELKTPLTLIAAPLRSINRNQLDADSQQHLGMAIKNADKLQQLISELVTFNKIETGGFPFYLQKGNPLAFIERALVPFREACREKHLALAVVTEDNGEEVWFSPSYLERILNNLMSNAIKFTPEGGSINVDARITARDDSAYTFLRFDVRDTGIGIVPEELNNIFQRFYQTKRGYNADNSGWGIGLSLIKRLVDTQKGHIDVQSTVGQGTCFSVWLCTTASAFEPENLITDADTVVPVEQYRFTAAETSSGTLMLNEATAEADDVAESRPTLLIVDDSTDLLHFLRQTFQPHYNVITATNGAEAWQIAHEQEVQMIISDVMMPKMDGNELCQRLKADMQTSHIPVILLTAKGDQHDVYEGYHSGAEAYVPKPFDPEILKLQVGNILRLIKQRQQEIVETDGAAIEETTLSDLDKAFLQKMNDLVEANIANSDFGIADITEHLGVSRSLLHLKMKNILGMPMGDYIRRKRLDKACQMLLKGYNVSETAYATGFSDPNYFSKAFKKHLGISPTEYLKKKEG